MSEQMKKLVDCCFILASGKANRRREAQQALMNSDEPAVDQFMNGRVEGPISFKYQNDSNL